MKIDLGHYAKEYEYWIKAFDSFVDRASIGVLKDSLGRLQSGAVGGREFRWATSRPVKLKPATSYDRANGESPAVQVRWCFQARFSPPPNLRAKPPIWGVKDLNTEVEVHASNPEKLVLRFHHDLKTRDQLGPHAHLQISEKFLESEAGRRLAVPRFPTLALLPTDCLDMVLSEFFPHEWPQSQSGAISRDMLRKGQIDRFTGFAEALKREWDGKRMLTPVSLLQNCYFPELRLA